MCHHGAMVVCVVWIRKVLCWVSRLCGVLGEHFVSNSIVPEFGVKDNSCDSYDDKNIRRNIYYKKIIVFLSGADLGQP